MREILFKAKRMDNGEWVEGCLIVDDEDYFIMPLFGLKSIDDVSERIGDKLLQIYACEVDLNTICQYTGLKDKYKRKIFENDLISFLDVSQYDNGYAEYYCLGQVLWDEETASFEVTERLSCESYEALDGDCEIIGNIFDNPELIGGGE